MRDNKENPIVKLPFGFALEIIEFSELSDEQNKFGIARHISKSRTSIGVNVRQAQNTESKNEFIHKLKIAAKQADETPYFLLLCKFARTYPLMK